MDLAGHGADLAGRREPDGRDGERAGRDGDLEGERVRVRVGGPLPIVAEVTPGAVADLRLADGGPVWVSVKATEVVVYPV